MPMSKPQIRSMQYSAIAKDEDDDNPHSSSSSKSFNNAVAAVAQNGQAWRRRLWLYVALIGLLGVFTIVVLMVVLGVLSHRRIIAEPEKFVMGLGCGNSTAEARAAGCEFDILSYSWTPAACFDRDTAVEFLAWLEDDKREFGAWPFFSDPDGREQVPDITALSERLFLNTYSTQEEHLGHCIFWMRHLERVNDGMVPQTLRGVGLRHAMHCTNGLLQRFEIGKDSKTKGTHAIFQVGFNTC